MKYRFQLLVAIAVTIAVIAFADNFLQRYFQDWIAPVINIGFTILVIFIAVFVFLENRDPTKTIAWLIVLLAFPYVGFVFYIVFGQSYRKRRLFQKQAYLHTDLLQQYAENRPLQRTDIEKLGDHQQQFFIWHKNSAGHLFH